MTVSSIKVKVVRKTNLRLKMLPRFPSSVTVASPILLSRIGGSYSFTLDIAALGNSLAASATIDATNASNITSGTLSHSRLPTLFKVDVGLGNVDNTADINKPFGIIDAKAYGVVADGVTDDTANLQNAYNNAAGRILKLPKGTIIVSSLNFNISGQKVIGSGLYDTIIKTNSASADCITISGAGSELSSVQVASTIASGSRTGNGVVISSGTSVKLDQVNSVGHKFGFYCTYFAAGIISRCYATSNNSHGVYLDTWIGGANNGNINEVQIIETNSNLNGGDGFHIRGGTNSIGFSLIRPTAANNSGNGITLENPDGTALHAVRDVWITQPEMSANTTTQIDASGNALGLGLTIDGGGLIEFGVNGINVGTMSGVVIGAVPINSTTGTGLKLNCSGAVVSGTQFAANPTQLELGATSSNVVLSGLVGIAGAYGTSATGLKITAGAGAFTGIGVDFSSSTTPLSGVIPSGSVLYACPSRTSTASVNNISFFQPISAPPLINGLNTSVSIAAAGNQIFSTTTASNLSWFIIRENTTTGDWVIGIATSGGVTIFNQSAGLSYSVTTTPAAGKYGIAYDGAGNYKIYNGAAGAKLFSNITFGL